MQLFEQTIEKDIFFGLKQYKLTYDEKYKRAKETLELLGLDFEKIKAQIDKKEFVGTDSYGIPILDFKKS